jgi:hypothetical protein
MADTSASFGRAPAERQARPEVLLEGYEHEVIACPRAVAAERRNKLNRTGFLKAGRGLARKWQVHVARRRF